MLTGHDDLAGMQKPQRTRGALRFVGDVGTAELRELYSGALAVVSPSRCEGFGLPLLEAAALGRPVIASSEAIPGTLRPYARSFAPGDVPALEWLMAVAARSPEASEEARRFARTQTWDLCARLTAEVYREVLVELDER